MPETETPPLLLTVYGRSYCHLCDDMIAALRTLQEHFSFEIKVVDIDSDDALEARLGEKVPVLMCDDRELCHYFLNEPVVTAFLSDLR